MNSFSISGYRLFCYTKSYDSLKCQTFDLLTVFGFPLTILPNLIARFNRNSNLLEAYLSNWLCPVCFRKKVLAFKQVMAGNYRLYAKTTGPILRLSSIEKPGFGNLICLSGHNLLFAEKKLWIMISHLTVFRDQDLKVFKPELKERVAIIVPAEGATV